MSLFSSNQRTCRFIIFVLLVLGALLLPQNVSTVQAQAPAVAISGSSTGILPQVKSSIAAATDTTFTAELGKSIIVDHWTEVYTPSCVDKEPGKYTVLTKPSHGTLIFDVEQRTEPSGNICAGKTLPMAVARYTWTDATSPATEDTFSLHWYTTDGYVEDESFVIHFGTPPQTKRHKVFFLVQGVTTSLTKTDDRHVPETGTDGFTKFGDPQGTYESLKKNFPGSAFRMFSYSSNYAKDVRYSCPDTFNQSLATYSHYLAWQIIAYLRTHANTDVYIIGHSQGGAVSFGLLELMATGFGQITTNGGAIKGVVTLDSPLGGVPGSWYGLINYTNSIEDKYKNDPDCKAIKSNKNFKFVSLANLIAAFKTDGYPNYGSSDLILGSSQIKSNEDVALKEATKGVSILTIGNKVDYLYEPTKCLGWGTGLVQGPFLDTQWVTNSAHVYSRQFTDTAPGTNVNHPCPGGDNVSMNHNLVLKSPAVEAAIAEFVRGDLPLLS